MSSRVPRVEGSGGCVASDPIGETRLATAVSEAARELLRNSSEPRIAVALVAMARLLDGDIKQETVLESILEIIPKFHAENKKAFQVGYDYMDQTKT